MVGESLYKILIKIEYNHENNMQKLIMTKIPFNEAKHGNKLSLQCLLLSIEGDFTYYYI
ncbi:Uncharacterised protein [Staphylococcus aureus]|nr:Uncharacterised protein [Staphylococcus aureus]SBC81643.1 Uncharacterised protein [Staphylococcus aureus]